MRGVARMVDRGSAPGRVRQLGTGASRVLGWLPWLLILIGASLRIVRFLHNRALWGDEAALALNLIHRTPRGLLEPLDFDQAAPILFLLAEKAAIGLFGSTEFALRALPLLVGLASLPLFWSVAKRVLEPVGALIALAFFALADPLVFYSAEVKQYGVDVTIALLLLYLLLPILSGAELTRRRAVVLGLVGTTVVWLSHPSVFVLAAAGVALLGAAVRSPDRLKVGTVVMMCSAWAASFLAAYLTVLQNTRTVQDELGLAGGGVGGHARANLGALLATTGDSFAYPVGVANTVTGLAAVSVVVGFVVIFRKNPLLALMLVAPGVVAFGAALLNRYPWGDRFVLFLVPSVILLMSSGLEELCRRTWKRMPVLAIGAIGLVLIYPAAIAARGMVHPPEIKRQEIRGPLSFLGAHWQEGDTLFVHYISQFALRYYTECEDCGVLKGWDQRLQQWQALPDLHDVPETLPERPAIRSRRPQLVLGEGLRPSFAELTEQLAPLRGRARVWLLFSTTTNKDFLLYLLDRWGKRLAVVTDKEAALYLYDLR